MSRSVLVSGASGFIGSQVCRRLVAFHQKDRIKALVRPSSSRSLIPHEVEIVEAELSDSQGLEKALKDVDVVIHCAADMTFYPKNEASMFKTNVDGTKNIIKASHNQKIKHFIFVSSYESLGPGSFSDRKRKEDAEPRPVYAYGRSKLIVNRFLEEFSQENPGFKYTTLMLPGVIGPDEVQTSFHEQLYWACHFGLFFFTPSETSVCQYIHIEDAVSGILLAMAKTPSNRKYLIVPNDEMTYEEIIRTSCQELGRIQPLIKLPFSLVRLAMILLKVPFSYVFEKQALFHEVTVDQLVLSRSYSNARAKSELGFEPKWTMKAAVIDGIEGRKKRGLYKSTFPIANLWLVVVGLIGIWCLSRFLFVL